MSDDDRQPPAGDDGADEPGTSASDPGSRRRRRVIAVSAAVLAAVVGVAIAVQVSSSRGAAPTPVSATTTSAAPSASPSPTPEPSAPTPEPPTRPLVAVTAAGDLVTLDATTGETLRVVGSGYYAGTGSRPSLSVTPDGAAVYVSRDADNDVSSEIVLVSLADGSESYVVDGWAPAVSPDGTSLAFERFGTGRSDPDKIALIIRDLRTGEESEIPDSESAFSERVVGTPTWTADSRRVALALGWYEPVDSTHLVLVDVATAASLGEAEQLSPEPDAASPSALTSWSSPAGTVDGSVAVTAHREELDSATGRASVTLGAVLVLDAASGAIGTQLAAPPGMPLGLAAEPGGRHLALLSSEDGSDGTATYTLSLSDGSGPFAAIAKEIVAISW